MSTGRDVTGPQLRALFEEWGVCSGRQKRPNTEGMETLAAAVRDLSREVQAHRGRPMEAADARHQRVTAAIRTLQADLPAWREDCRSGAALAAAGGSLQGMLRRQAQALDALSSALAGALRASAVPGRFSDLAPAVERWHDFVVDLADAFQTAMLTTNDGLVVGLTADGPLVRFLVRAIPLVSGECPTAEAAGKYLRYLRDRNKAAGRAP